MTLQPPKSQDVDAIADCPGTMEEMPSSNGIFDASRPPSPDLGLESLYHVPSSGIAGETIGYTVDADTSQYDRFSSRRKSLITAILSLCGFLSPVSSTSILSATPELAATYTTSGSMINLANALYLVSMGIAPCFWGPMTRIYGRRWISIISGSFFLIFSIATALAPNLATYFTFRILTAFQGTCFLVVGPACIGDIYAPAGRGTAMGWFLSGALIGPAFGPVVGGLIVTFESWRVIFWLQTALGGLSLVLVVLFLPETIPTKRIDSLKGQSLVAKTLTVCKWIDPSGVFRLLYEFPSVLFVAVASSSLLWNMYSLLTPITYVLNPRFHLTSPIQSGLFYLAPGMGYLAGSFFGGRWADRYVKIWIKKRGRRVPEDRLRSCLWALGIVIPGCMLIYGWAIDKSVGGIPLPVMVMFAQGFAQLFCFPSLNTYCIDVLQEKGRSAEALSSTYLLRYLTAAVGSAVVLPIIERIGVGWFTTLSCGFLVSSAGLVMLTIRSGEKWREERDKKENRKIVKEKERQEERSGQSGVIR